MRSRRRIIALWLLFALGLFVYLNQSSVLFKHQPSAPYLLAHRGLAQTFPMSGITAQTNTAARIYEPEHPYLENTLASMEAAFAAGADMVELDIQMTRDRQLAVFHDSLLEYRTDLTGRVRDYTMKDLRLADVGYGYTADEGKSYPFRGKGVGLMPSLDEVFSHFPDHALLIHIKNTEPEEAELLVRYLDALPPERLSQVAVYGPDKSIELVSSAFGELRVASRQKMMKSVISYVFLGWTGYVPPGLRNSYLPLPLRYARMLWGWPHRFVQRMQRVNTLFVLVAGDGTWSEGFDTPEDIEQIPRGYSGGIWTNRVDVIAPLVK